ncbi:catalase family peroxidase [Novilysobacter erysipheiresistens]|uniref:catalase family peroxidase n=1 Tax=Novilysobacter erysipheiresistens TaxID=1749332 RepID=UPI003CE4826E
MHESEPSNHPSPSPPAPSPPFDAQGAIAAQLTRGRLLAFAGIGAIALGSASAFAWTAGWLGGERLTAPRVVNAMEANGPAHPGFRRNHAKGVCVAGTFRGTEQGQALSTATVFSGEPVPVLGRFSIGGPNPHGADNSARVRSMALQFGGPDASQWRMALNSFPFFAVATPQAFHQQTLAKRPDPATGKPDPAAMEGFLATHPQARKFRQWAKTAPWSDSWANTQYNSVNAFRFIDADGSERLVRWSMRPHAAVHPLDAAERERADADFLAADLQTRLAQGSVHWDMVVTLAAAGDPVNDPSRPWPGTREQVVAGTLTLVHAEPQATGECRDVNFDPLILPSGVAASDDPILAARSAAYSQSFNRRQREIALGRGDAATATEPTR